MTCCNPLSAPPVAGLTLRDYFAAAVLQGAYHFDYDYNRDLVLRTAQREAARLAYEMADAMITARGAPTAPQETPE